jgi:two-component system sensor histidine kinase PhoQ
MERTSASRSIRARLIAANLLLLPLFLGLVFWILDRAFTSYQVDSLRERLRLQNLLLAKAADWDGTRWRLDSLDEPRLGMDDSGLYAFVLASGSEVWWQSPSAAQMGDLAQPLDAVESLVRQQGLYDLDLGASVFMECSLDQAYFCHATGVAWGSTGPSATFLILERQAEVIAARDAYRGYLLGLSVVLALLLLLVQAWVIRWGLAPLGFIARDIGRLEAGELDRLESRVPRELEPLTESVNQLLDSEQQRRQRVRNTMDRLTHVLKTPLMLLRNSPEEGTAFRQLVDEQVNRMLGIVEGELARARLDGRAPDVLGQSVRVYPVMSRIVKAYQRLPRLDGQQEIEIDTRGIAADAAFKGEERDLQDLFGSILENSLKYCRSRIEVKVDLEAAEGRDWLVMSVADDGEGVPPGSESDILRRGARADTAGAGQGLGLSIAVEIVSAYGGGLQVGNSAMGGALFTARLPGARTPPGGGENDGE